MSIEITTSLPCSINCRLCPQDILRKKYRGRSFLSLYDFKTIIDKIPREIKITFSGFSEPFLNYYTMDMIEYAAQKGHKIDLYSTLIGLKTEDVSRLAKIGLNFFVLHLPDSLGNAHILITEEYLHTLAMVLKNINIDIFSVMNKSFPNNGRAGNLSEFKGHRKGFFRCTYLENNIFVLLPSCDVVLCCNDYGLQHVLGNLLTQDYIEIVNCKEYKTIKRNRFMLDGDILCRKCKCAYNPLFYSLLTMNTAAKRFALKFYSKDTNARDQLIREYDARI